MFIEKNDNIFLAGHNGMLGKSIYKKLINNGYKKIYTVDKKKINLKDSNKINTFLKNKKFDAVINCAAKVGGIISNQKYPADYIIDNSLINNNLILSSHLNNITKYINIGSSCIYPKDTNTPIKENQLLTNSLERTNEYYSISKIHALKLCEAINKQFGHFYFSLMPTNLYGPEDNFDLEHSHVIPALINKFFHANLNKKKNIKMIGTGNAKRDFLHVDDLSDAIITLCSTKKNKLSKIFNKKKLYHINVGSSSEISIKNLTKIIAKIIGYKGIIEFEKKTTIYNGVMSKKLDNSLINSFGWNAKINLEMGLKQTIEWYISNYK